MAGSILFVADFSTKSNDKLVSIAGSVAKEDIVSYVSEIENRVNKMSEQKAGEFKNRLELQEKQVISAMSEQERAQYKTISMKQSKIAQIRLSKRQSSNEKGRRQS